MKTNIEENKVPDFIKNRIDIKTDTINTLALFLEELNKRNEKSSLNPKIQVFLLTNFGTVKGDIVIGSSSEDNTQNSALILNNTFIDIRNNLWANDSREKNNIVNNTSYITVLNAKIVPFANPNIIFNFKILNLFADQITGFTFGSND